MSPNALLGGGLAACAAVIVIAVVASRFFKSEPPPPPPPPPTPTERTVTGVLRYSEGYYRASLEDDAKRYAIPAPALDVLARPLPYADELPAPHHLKADRDSFDTPHLHLTTHVIKEWATTDSGEGFRYEHMVLEITNRTARPLAYRIETAVEHPERCKAKGSIQHNAIALEPNETVRRTECLWHPKATLTVKRVETLELPDLGYFYVSRLTPTQVLYDERTSGGHEAPKKTKPCQFVPWREIQAAGKGVTGWDDVIDFYARHNCDEYSFWRGYRRWTTSGTLPSRPAVAVAAPPAAAPDGGTP